MKLFRIKPGKKELLLAWGRRLQEDPEALETLREEGISFEGFFFFHFNGEDYAIGISDNPNPLPASNRPINQEHKRVLKECLESVTNLVPIYMLLRKNAP